MKTEPTLRPAASADVAAITRIVRDAYSVYLPRMGKPPAPMLADYAATVTAKQATVLDAGGTVAGVIVLVEEPDHLLIENIAIDPRFQHRGLGRMLVEFAEQKARTRGYGEVRLYTNVLMTENVEFYGRLGFAETHRATEDGYARVFMRKRISSRP